MKWQLFITVTGSYRFIQWNFSHWEHLWFNMHFLNSIATLEFIMLLTQEILNVIALYCICFSVQNWSKYFITGLSWCGSFTPRHVEMEGVLKVGQLVNWKIKIKHMLIITDMPICFPDATCHQHNIQASLLSI